MEKQKDKKKANPLFKIAFRMSILAVIIGGLLYFSDAKGYFNPDEENNHTLKKWNAFYELTSDGNEIDVMLFGNSHLYTGINPKNLSLTLGANAFVFASPGTNIADSYFCLKEAAKISKPKLVIMETYGINDFDPYTLNDASLSDQIKSFSARKDVVTKLQSTPFLFAVDNYFYAWSTTIRNHNYLFTNMKQINENKKNARKKRKRKEKLYLGRYVRFTTGLEEDVMSQYDTSGAPVHGEEYSYSTYADDYAKKMVDYCNKENIPIMFLTLPMYEKHISGYENWDKKLAEIIDKYSDNWLNLQKEPNYNGFDKFAFENTYERNQHMTYGGSLLATYKLADYIRDSLKIELPQRKKEDKWHQLFYGEEGYFENFRPSKNDKNNKVICSDKKLRNITLEDCFLLDMNNEKMHRFIAKVDKKALGEGNHQNTILRLLIKINIDGKQQVASVDLKYDAVHQLKDVAIFATPVKPIMIEQVVDGAIIKQ